MKKLKKIIIIVIILATFLLFIGFTFFNSNNLNQFVDEHTLIYVNLPFKNNNILKDLNIIKKISLIDSNFNSLNEIPISEIKDLSLSVIQNNLTNEKEFDFGVTLEFKQKDKLKDLVDLNKDSILKLNSNIIGFKTNKNIFNNFKKKGFKNSFLDNLKLLFKNNIGNIYFDFNQFNSRNNYFNNISSLKSSVLKINQNKKEINFDFKYENNPYIKELSNIDFNNNFVFGFKEKDNLKNILINLKKNLALKYPIVKERSLPDGSSFLEKVADYKDFNFKKNIILNNDFYILNHEKIDLILGKINNIIIFSNNKDNIEKYIQEGFNIEDNLFFYIPLSKNNIKSLYLKNNNNFIKGIIKL